MEISSLDISTQRSGPSRPVDESIALSKYNRSETHGGTSEQSNRWRRTPNRQEELQTTNRIGGKGAQLVEQTPKWNAKRESRAARQAIEGKGSSFPQSRYKSEFWEHSHECAPVKQSPDLADHFHPTRKIIDAKTGGVAETITSARPSRLISDILDLSKSIRTSDRRRRSSIENASELERTFRTSPIIRG